VAHQGSSVLRVRPLRPPLPRHYWRVTSMMLPMGNKVQAPIAGVPCEAREVALPPGWIEEGRQIRGDEPAQLP
jgi:hypothetical protein